MNDELELPRKARNSKRPRMKNSMTCAALLMNSCTKPTSWGEIPGIRRRKTAFIKEEVFPWENVSVDIQKIKPIPRTTGSQYLRKYCLKGILGFIHQDMALKPAAVILRSSCWVKFFKPDVKLYFKPSKHHFFPNRMRKSPSS